MPFLRNNNLLAFILISVGFILRLYASTTVPLTFDEYEKINFVNAIFFEKGIFSIPLGNEVTQNPPLLPYLIKISISIFGDNILALRLPSVLFGTFALLITFLLIRENIDNKTALLTLFFMTFCQFHIGSTRIAWEDGLLLFFISTVLFLTQKAIMRRKRIFVFLAAGFMGLGLFVKGTIITIFPFIIYYIFFYKENKRIFSLKDLALFLTIAIAINAPNFVWNIANNSPNYKSYLREAAFFEFNLVPTALFLGEILITISFFVDDAIIKLMTSYEYPFIDWVMGILCLGSAIYVLKLKRNSFLKLLTWIFYFNFIFLSILSPRSGGGLPLHLDNFWWAVILIIPGFIFTSIAIIEINNVFYKTKILTVCLLTYMVINSFNFINFPANCFIPRKTIQLQELRKLSQGYAAKGEFTKASAINKYIADNYIIR